MKILSKIISVVVVVALFLQISAFAAVTPQLTVSMIQDPVNNIILINGSISTGPERTIALSISDAQGNIIYPDSVKSVDNGAFSFAVGTSNLPNGAYTVKVSSAGCADFTKPVSIPFAGAAQKISANVLSSTMLMASTTTLDSLTNKVQLKATNTTIRQEVIDPSQYVVTGLPEGLSVSAQGLAGNIVELTFTGTATQEITTDKEVTIKLLSTMIAGGSANTDSDLIGPITIKTYEFSKKVNIVGSGVYQVKMQNRTQINPNVNKFEVKIDTRKLVLVDSTKPILVKGTDFDYTLPQILEGLKLEAVANVDTNTIQFTLTGTPIYNITSNVLINDIIIYTRIVPGTTVNSDPITIEVVANNNVEEVPQGGSPGTGTNTTPITSGNVTAPALDPIIPDSSKGFTDVKGHWGESYINYLFNANIVKGVTATTFEPDRSVTRAEFISLIVRALQLKEVPYSNSFSDVGSGDWYAKTVQTALQNNLITANDVFRPNDTITREEMTKMTVAAWLTKHSKPATITKATALADYSTVSDWAKEYVDLGVQAGLVKGDNGNNFAPKSNATRAESSTIIYRLLINR